MTAEKEQNQSGAMGRIYRRREPGGRGCQEGCQAEEEGRAFAGKARAGQMVPSGEQEAWRRESTIWEMWVSREKE